MDNLTHSLVGAVMGQAGLKKKTGLAMPALIIGANLPDVDAACFFWLEGTEHLGLRRGITHGPIAWVVLPLILAGLLWWFDRWQDRRGKRPEGRLPVSFKWLYLLSFIGCLSHPLFDWFNVYGIRFLEPFSSAWFYGDTLFIIDVWLWALLGFGTWFSMWRERRCKPSRWPAALTIAAATAYIGGNWIVTEASWVPYAINSKVVGAEGVGSPSEPNVPAEQMIASPVPFWPHERELILGEHNNYFVIPPGTVPSPSTAKPITDARCGWPDLTEVRVVNSQVDAFLFWSRAPFAGRAEDGSVILYDARFYDPRARDRFSIALPDVECVELGGE